MDSPGFEPGASASRIRLNNPVRDSYRLKKSTIEDYLEYRFSRIKSENSKYWIEKTIKELMRHTKREISRKSLMKFQNWFKRNYGWDAQCKMHDNTKNLLEWLYKKTGNPYFRDLKDVLERPVRPTKKLNKIILREDDIRNLIKAIMDSPSENEMKTKYIAGVLFMAYTGQRPEATVAKLTVKEFREAIKMNPPMIYIPESKDKEDFPHWVPLHPIVVEWLEKYLKTHKRAESECPFSYYTMRKLFDRLNVKAIHTSRKITPSHLRKFFEQMCNNVLVAQLPDGRVVPAMHPGLRDYIMAHNTGSLDVQSYDGKLPSEIYDQYMAAWGEVNLIP
jgi:integrase